MRCRRCQYALWGLSGRSCPECDRAFELKAWDWSESDATLACAACGHGLGPVREAVRASDPGSTCPACGAALDEAPPIVQPGPSGLPPKRPRRWSWTIPTWVCTAIMVVSAIVLLAVLFDAAQYAGRRPIPNPLIVLLSWVGISVGVCGAWPRRLRWRIPMTALAVVLAMGATVGALVVQEHSRAVSQRWFGQSASLRGVVQAVEIYTQQQGVFPPDPQTLLDGGWVDPQTLSPSVRNASTLPAKVSVTPLAGGWITAGETHIDWTPAGWLAPDPLVLAVYERSLRRGSLLIAWSDGSAEDVRWADVPARLATWNADRAAHGLPPIPQQLVTPP